MFYEIHIDDDLEIRIDVNKGYYPSCESLMKVLNDTNNVIGSAMSKDIQFQFDVFTKKASLQIFNERIWIKISDSLQDILNFPNQICASGLHKASSVMNINKVQSLYIYSDVVEPHIVGDTIVPLMRIVPISGTYGETVVHSFEPVHYYPLQNKSFFTIETDIRDSSGRAIAFEFGKVIAILQFRKKRSPHFI